MIKDYSGANADVGLIATSQVELGVRNLSSFLKERGCKTTLGLFDSLDSQYSKKELESILKWIGDSKLQLIGVSSIEYSRGKTTQLMSAIRDKFKIPLVAGGVDATSNPEHYLHYADYVIRGEGEHSLDQLVQNLSNSKELKDISNLCYSKDGKIKKNPVHPLIQDLDSLPFDDWLDTLHHFELKDGEVKQKQNFVLDMSNHPILYKYDKSAFMITIRGCAFDCSYCVNHQLKKLNPGEKPIRKRSIESVIERVEQLKRHDPSMNMVYFFDDDFFLRTNNEIKQFAKGWKNKIDLPFYAYCTPLTLNEDKLKELVDAGLVVINMGVQSGSERTNKEIYHRNMGNKDVLKASRVLNKYISSGRFGLLPPWFDIIINNPYETKEDLLKTIKLFKELPKPYSTFMHSLEIFSGTRLHEKAIQDRIIQERDDSANYNFHDTLKHMENLVKRGGNYYLNSLIYWMDGEHNEHSYGIIPSSSLDLLTKNKTIDFFDNHPKLVSTLNYVLPTEKRKYFLKQGLKKCLKR